MESISPEIIPQRSEPTEIKEYKCKHEAIKVDHKPGIIDLGPFGTLITTKANKKPSNYSEFTTIKELEGRIVEIKNSNFYEWETFKEDSRRAKRISLDLEFSGIAFQSTYTPKFKDRLLSFQVESAAKHSIIKIGFFLVTEEVDDTGMKKQMAAAYCIHGSPDTSVFFSSLDFLQMHKFKLNQYKNYRINLQQEEVKSAFREILTGGVPIYVHNGIYDLLQLIKLLYPKLFKSLMSKSMIEDLDTIIDKLGFNVYDTRYIYDHLSTRLLAEAIRRQKDQWICIAAPNIVNLAELAFLLLDINGVALHNPAIDALVTFKLGEFYEQTQKLYLERMTNFSQLMAKNGRKLVGPLEKETNPDFVTHLEKYRNRIYSAQRDFD